MKQQFAKNVSLAMLFASLTFLLGSSNLQAQNKHLMPGPQNLPFSEGVLAGNTLYISGQQGRDENDKLVAGGIGPETEAALTKVANVVKAAGFQLKDVVSVTVYMTDINEFQEMNRAYRKFMPDPKPARATVQVGGLFQNARVEISAIAVKQK